MAYKFSKGKVYRGDIYNEDDTQQNTYLDWSEDAAGFVVAGELALAVSASVVSVAVPVVIDGNVSSSGIIYGTDLILNTNDDSTQTTIYVQGMNGTEFYSLGTGGFNLTSGGEIRLLAGANSALHLGTNAADSKVVVTSAGDVGIGTTSPTEKLEVYPNTDVSAVIGRAHIGYNGTHPDAATFSHVDHDAATTYALYQGANGLTILNAAASRPIHFRIANVDKMHLTTDGALGIGTTTPTSTFEVSGSQSGNYTAVSTSGASALTLDGTHYIVNYTGNGDAVFTLPDVSGITGRQYHILHNCQGDIDVLTVTGSGGDFLGVHLEGPQTSVNLNGNTPQSISIVSTGANWFILHDGRSEG
jgi:hypothetical protein